jgi:DNA-binding response OmpR family regulator
VKLLLVEDDGKIAAAVKRGLEAEGFAVEVATDGDEGLWLATEGAFDLVVLDILLPGRNGYRICAELRQAGSTVPILMLTAKDGDLDEAEALDTGADDYLVKPFSFPVLVARVRALLRRAGSRGVVPTAVGDLRIDSAARRAWRAGQELALTAREFDVLEYLVRPGRPGRGQGRDPGRGVGPGLRRRPQHRRGVRAPASPQARRAVGQALDPDRPRRRLPGHRR